MSGILVNKRLIDSLYRDVPEEIRTSVTTELTNRMAPLFEKIISEARELFKSNNDNEDDDLDNIMDHAFKSFMGHAAQSGSDEINKLLLPALGVNFEQSTPEKVFNAIKKILPLGINVNGAFLSTIYNQSPFGQATHFTALDFVLLDNPLIATKKFLQPSLIAMLIINGGVCFSTSKQSTKIDISLNRIFDRVKPLFISKKDKRSFFSVITNDLMSVMICNQIWLEAHTFRD